MNINFDPSQKTCHVRATAPTGMILTNHYRAHGLLPESGEPLRACQIFGHPAAAIEEAEILAGAHAPPGEIWGSRALEVEKAEIHPLVDATGHLEGWRFEDQEGIYGWFQAWHSQPGSAPEKQAEDWFASLPQRLARHGFSFSEVLRTWFYLHHILDWYDEFNAVRTRFFEEHGVFTQDRVPASTGVGAGNPSGAAVCADLLCFQPKAETSTSVSEVTSPLQCSALDYRSSFSRAVEISGRQGRWLMVSGTASIAPGGRTEFIGDADAQVDLTMQVLEALLTSRGMNWENVWRGIAYLRDPSVLTAYQRWLRCHQRTNLPLIPAVCEICRDDLLFEVELDALTSDSL